MSNASKASRRATPTLRTSNRTDTAKIAMTRSTTTAMKGSSLWATSPTLQAANTAWNTAADALEANAKAISNLRAQLAVLEAAQLGLRHDWATSTNHMTAVVGVVANGSPDQVKTLGYDVVTHAAVGPLPAPEGLTTALGKAVGQVELAWIRGAARHGFLVQHASDVTNVATYAAAVPSTKAKFTLTGAVSQSVVHFRVAAIDPSAQGAQSPWSDWIAGTVR